MRPSRIIPPKSDPAVAIVVDGECEMWYIQMLKRNLRSIRIKIAPQIPQNKSIADQCELVKTLAVDYTHVLWIIDLDVVLAESKNAKRAEKTSLQTLVERKLEVETKFKSVEVIVNNPCIEFWFLLHFEETGKFFDDCAKAEQQLRKHLKDYEKTERYYTKPDKDIFLRLRPHLATALKNAEKIGMFNPDQPFRGLAEMHLLFQCAAWKAFFDQELKGIKKDQ